MKGIQFIVDDQGEKTAVVIDLKQWGKEWEAFYHALLNDSQSDESWLHQSPFLEKLEQALERLVKLCPPYGLDFKYICFYKTDLLPFQTRKKRREFIQSKNHSKMSSHRS